MITIAFDVDGCLLGADDSANEDIRTLLRILHGFRDNNGQAVRIVVWSGSGELYAATVSRHLHISQWVDKYASKTDQSIKPTIAIDDQNITKGTINLIMKGREDNADE